MEDRVRVTNVVIAWEAAKTTAAKRSEADGDGVVRSVPKDLTLSTRSVTRKWFETQHYCNMYNV